MPVSKHLKFEKRENQDIFLVIEKKKERKFCLRKW